MNVCTSTEGHCTTGRNWVCFWFEIKGYDSRPPTKTPPVGPWWEDGHGFGHVSVVAYIPLKGATLEEAERHLKEYWPGAYSINSRVYDRISYTWARPCPKWWKETGSSCQ